MVRITPAEKPLIGSLNRVESLLHAQLRSPDPYVHRVLAQVAAGQGKRLRARMVLLSAWAAGALGRRSERLAAVFELLHLATLVHDDVIDGSRRRRHRSTLNARFGNAAAVLAGDLIFVRAVRLLESGGYAADIHACVVRAAAAVCQGELQELRHQRDLTMTPAEYLAVVRNKTASLLAAACESGARLGAGSGRRPAALARYGREFGIAFQVCDDLLDLTGSPGRLGKPVGQDRNAGRMTLPVILGLRRARVAVAAGLRASDRRPGGLRRALAESGALDQAARVAGEHARRAQAALRDLPASGARQALLELAGSAVLRKD